jgi:molybdopterin adenylyltransferase
MSDASAPAPAPETARIGVLVISDRAYKGVYVDQGGPAIRATVGEFLASPWEPIDRLVPDERPRIEASLREMCDQLRCHLVITTGGTGPAARDVTPEATEAVCDKLLPGFGELMRAHSLKYVPTAILSRQTAGIRGATMIINCPGKPRSIRECLEAVFPAVPYGIELVSGLKLVTNPAVINSYRPA